VVRPTWLIQIISSLSIFSAFSRGVSHSLRASSRYWNEKFSAGIQNRYVPTNRVGPFGLFQPVADGIKDVDQRKMFVPARGGPDLKKVVHFSRRS